MRITREFMFSCSTNGHGGWNKDQLALLGVNWPPEKGWLGRLIGTEVHDEIARQVRALTGHRGSDGVTHHESQKDLFG